MSIWYLGSSAAPVSRCSDLSAISGKPADPPTCLSLSSLENAPFIITSETFHNIQLLHSFLPPKDKAKPHFQFQDRPNSRWQCQKGIVTVTIFILFVQGLPRTQAWQREWSFQRPRVWFSHWGIWAGMQKHTDSKFNWRSHPFKLKCHRLSVLVNIKFYTLKWTWLYPTISLVGL